MRILHISDPQFGAHHRFSAADGGLAQLLLEGLDGVAIDLVAVTGDVAEWSKPAEYAQARAFLEQLCLGLGLKRDRVLVVPGNHDVSRSACNRYLEECEEHDRAPVPPFWPKWQHYKAFVDDWYGTDAAHFVPSEPWSWWEVPELDLVAAGFNSTLPETTDVHDWAIGEAQVRWFAERLRSTRARFRIGLVHHDLFHGAEAATRERERLRDLPLTLLLHGHTHIQTTEKVGDAPALGVGSLGIEKEWREEDVANQFQLLELDERRCHRSLRRFHGPKAAFLPDDEVLSPRDRSFRLDADDTTFREAGFGVRFVDRVAEVLRLREDGADVVVLNDEAIQVRRGFHRRLVGAADTVDGVVVDRYLRRLADFRADDPTLPAEIVHRASTRTLGEVTLRSLVELQGLVDFRALRNWQRERIAEDTRYREPLYVPQRVRLGTPHPGPDDDPRSALEVVHDLVAASGDEPRLALVLAPFGTGKTFLIRQLARQLEREWTEGARVPLWIELRHLEKASSFEALLAAHLSRAGQRRIDHEQLAYMRREGRVVLLFDGFDELVLRVSYDRATEHLETLAAAADGRARVVVTSRTEHFLRTRDAEGALLRKIRDVSGLSVLHIQEFSTAEAESYLCLRMGDAGAKRFERLRNIPNLLDLARTPRMLEMLADLDDADLDDAERRVGPMNAARLYDTVIERWLRKEEERRTLPGSARPLGWTRARQAATRLAERAWMRTAEEIEAEDLRAVAGGVAAPGYTLEEAAQELGSGTLLVRDEEARFRFAHRSVLEFLVAERCAGALNAGEPAPLLDCGEVSSVLVRFLGELAGDALDEWARAAVVPGGPEGRRRNALAVAAARKLHVVLDLSGQDLRGRDDLRELDLRGADLSRADLRGLDLGGVDLSGARLEGARLDDARLAGANLEGCTGTPSVKRTSFLLARGWREERPLKPFVDCGGPVTKLAWFEDGGLASITGGVIRVYGPDLKQRVVLDHPGVATVVVATQDGHLLATGGVDGVMRVWDAGTGELTRELRGHSAAIRAACFVGGTGELVSLDEGGALIGWDARSNGVKWTDRRRAHFADIAWLPPANEIVVAAGRDGALVGVAGGALSALPRQGSVERVITTADGTGISGRTNDGRLVRWLRGRGGSWTIRQLPRTLAKALSTSSRSMDQAPSNAITDRFDESSRVLLDRSSADQSKGNVSVVAYSPDTTLVAEGFSQAGLTVRDTDAADDGQIVGAVWTRPCNVIRILSRHTLIVAGDDGAVTEWNTDSHAAFFECAPETPDFTRIASSGDGAHVAIGSWDGIVVVHKIGAGPLTPLELDEVSPVAAIFFSTTTSVRIQYWSGRQVAWDFVSNRLTDHDTDGHGMAAFLPDGSLLAEGVGTNEFVIVGPDGSTQRTFAGASKGVQGIEVSPDGTVVAARCEHGYLRTFPVDNPNHPTDLPPHRGTVRALAWSPDGCLLASAADDGTIHLTHPATATLVRTLTAHHGAIRSLAFSPDGLDLYSAGDDGRILRWDVASGKLMGWMAAGPRGSVCVSTEGRYRTDGDVKGWAWFGHGMHRYDPDEVDRLLPHLRVPRDEAFPWVRPG